MRLFSYFYQKIMRWSQHRYAPFYLYLLSFAESSFFPIPPDFMLAPMALAKPNRAFTFAFYTTLSSVIGGLFGYLIGYFFMHFLTPFIAEFGYTATFAKVASYFSAWGFWVMFFAGFAFIPYKFFTITAGALHMPLVFFILGSLAGRGGRFFLVVLLIRWRGEAMEKLLLQYVDKLGWLGLSLLLTGFAIYHYV